MRCGFPSIDIRSKQISVTAFYDKLGWQDRPEPPKDEASLAANRRRGAGTFNFQWVASDFLEILGKSRPTDRQSKIPKLRPLIADTKASFPVAVSAPIPDRLKSPTNRHSMPRLRSGIQGPLIRNALPAISRRKWGGGNATDRPPIWGYPHSYP